MFHRFEETRDKHRAIKTERLLTVCQDTPLRTRLPSPSLRSVPGHAFTIREDDLKAVRMRYHLGVVQHCIHTEPKWMKMESGITMENQ